MSLPRRLGLERGKSAREAMDVVCSLLDRHGQGGNCFESRYRFTYHNSFIVADRSEAWILETAGPHWAAEQIKCMCCQSKVNALKLYPLGYWHFYLSKDNSLLSTIWIISIQKWMLQIPKSHLLEIKRSCLHNRRKTWSESLPNIQLHF